MTTSGKVARQMRALQRVVIIASIPLLLFGWGMMGAWMVKDPTPAAWWPGFFDTKFNTALLFAAAGGGLLSALRQAPRLSVAFSALMLLVSGLTLLEYVGGVALGVDQLLMRDFYAPDSPYPGRMSPGTAVCFACSGAALFLLSGRVWQQPWRVGATELLSFMVFAFGAQGLIGHVSGIALAYSWGSYARMAILTSTGFILLGGALLAVVWHRQRQAIAQVPLWVPGVLCILVLLFDLATPRGIAAGVAYVPLVFCSLWFSRAQTAFVFATIATVLIVSVFLVNPISLAPTWVVLINRALSVGVVWLMAAIVYLQRRSEERRYRSERELAVTGKLLQSIVSASTDAIISTDMAGHITSWNGAAEALFGYLREEALGQPILRMIPPALQAQEAAVRERVKATLHTEMLETQWQAKDGTMRDVALSIAPLRDADGTVIGTSKVVRDISERLEAERTREQLHQAQKMESIGQLTGGIAHDFNNLLAVVIGNMDLLAEQVHDPALQALIKPCLNAAEQGASLTRQLLAFGRKQALQPKVTGVNELMRRFVSLARHALGERVEIVQHLDDALWLTKVDPSQLQNALLNLAVNARDAMPGGGKLILETRNVTLDEAYAGYNAEIVPGDYVVIAVSDTGTGMSAEVAEKVFEPFFTTKGVGKGSGLGLSMVYGFVKQSAGYITIYSEVGHGTTFKIYLPRTHEAMAEDELSSLKTIALVAPAAKTVLVVEDNPSVLQLTTSMVKSFGYVVLQAETGDAAMEILRQREDIDLLLTDVMLPGALNGPQLAEQAKALYPRLRVLFNSGYAEHAILKSGMLEEGVHLIGKPFRKRQLAEKIEAVLQ